LDALPSVAQAVGFVAGAAVDADDEGDPADDEALDPPDDVPLQPASARASAAATAAGAKRRRWVEVVEGIRPS
jgi:hypothetical protein